MKILSLGLVRFTSETPECVILDTAHHLDEFSFFTRGSVAEMMVFFTRTLLKRTKPGTRQTITHEGHLCHCYMRSDGLGAIAICDAEYPSRVAFTLISQMQQDFIKLYGEKWTSATEDSKFPLESMKKALKDYQDPAKADALTKIAKDLDETKEVLHKTIDSVLERGEKLDNLVSASDDLTSQSKMFYKEAKKTNACCKMM